MENTEYKDYTFDELVKELKTNTILDLYKVEWIIYDINQYDQEWKIITFLSRDLIDWERYGFDIITIDRYKSKADLIIEDYKY